MKKNILILLFLPLLGLTSCVKQKNCEGCKEREEVGWLQYLKEPVTNSFYAVNENARKKITAIFYFDIDDEWGIPIAGNIPKKYQSGDFIRVRVCIEHVEKAGTADHILLCKLTCIEKED